MRASSAAPTLPDRQHAPAAMRPTKTELARQTLETHSRVLGMRERRLLILCDGRRDLDELKQLFGEDVATLLIQLVAAGYLAVAPLPSSRAATPARAAAPAPAPHPLPPPLPHAAPAPAAPPIPAAVANAADAGPPAPAHVPRRPVLAARVYLVDVLELQRDDESLAHRQRLQSRLDEPALFQAMAQALAFLRTRVAPSLLARIHERLVEVLPEEDAHRLRVVSGDAGAAAGRQAVA